MERLINIEKLRKRLERYIDTSYLSDIELLQFIERNNIFFDKDANICFMKGDRDANKRSLQGT